MPFEYSSNGFFIRKLKTPAHLKRCAGQNRVAYRCSTDSKQANKYTSEELFGRSLVVGDGVTAADERPVLRAVTILASNGFLPSSIGNGIEQRQRIGIGSRTQVEVHDSTVTGLGQIIGSIPIIRYIATDGTQIDRQRCIALLGYAGSADIRVVTEVGIDMVELGSGCRVDLIVADIVLEEGNQLAGGQLGAQFGDQVAIRTGNGGHRAAVLVVESDTVESVLIYGIGENRCKLIGLRVIETREVDILPVRQEVSTTLMPLACRPAT